MEQMMPPRAPRPKRSRLIILSFRPVGLTFAPLIYLSFRPIGLTFAPLIYLSFRPIGLTFAPLMYLSFRPIGLTFAPLIQFGKVAAPLEADGLEEVGVCRHQSGPSAFQPGLPHFQFRDALRQLPDLDELAFDASKGSENVVRGVHGGLL